MKTELSCNIVRDLLPSYADSLTSPETNRAVETHLADCPDCARACARMKQREQAPQDSRREVDFLKRQRRKTRLAALVTALAVLVLAAGVWLIPVCFIGTPLDTEKGIHDQVICSAAVEDNTLTLTGFLTDGSRFVRAGYQQEGNVLNVTLYHSNSAPLRFGSFEITHRIDESVTEVNVLGYTFWQDGVPIQQNTNTLWNSLTASEATSEESIASAAYSALKLDQQLGSTGWAWTQEGGAEANTLYFRIFGSGVSTSADTAQAELLAEKNSALIFATQPTVERIVWNYSTVEAAADTDGSLGLNQTEQSWSFTPDEVSQALGLSAPGEITSIGAFQTLLNTLELHFNGVCDSSIADLNFSRLKIYQGTGAEIAGLSLRLYTGDQLSYETTLSPAGGIEADTIAAVDLPQSGTAQWNSAVSIDDIGQDANVSRVSSAWFTLCVLDEAGAEHRTNAMPVSILSGRSYCYLLSGNAENGYTLNAF